MGKPSKYSPELGNEIVRRLSTGETLKDICRDPKMPEWWTFYDWEEANPSFKVSIARARDIGADAIAQEALRIADTPVEGMIEKYSEKDGKSVTREDMLGHRRLQVETRLKLLAKWNPRKYGEKTEITHEAGDTLTQFLDKVRKS